MTEISGMGAASAFHAATQAPSTIQPQSLHYAPPSGSGSSKPARSEPATAFGDADSQRKVEADEPRRVDITV